MLGRQAIRSLQRCTKLGSVFSFSTAVGVPTEKTFEGSQLHLFNEPKVVVPSFDLSRRFGNFFAQTIYSSFFEKNFTVGSLVRGANEGVQLLAEMFVKEQWDRMESIAVKDLIEELKIARKGTNSKLEKALAFRSDDILISFLYSSMFSGKNLFKLSENKNTCVYFTVVTYVRLSDSVPLDASISQLNSKYKQDVLICNSTFSRVLNPLGVWKITAVNYFV